MKLFGDMQPSLPPLWQTPSVFSGTHCLRRFHWQNSRWLKGSWSLVLQPRKHSSRLNLQSWEWRVSALFRMHPQKGANWQHARHELVFWPRVKFIDMHSRERRRGN
mmetsp:Transcript_144621/g.462358  ORF Transcript_144621/g.462358 Transcript_144621/m.462358 type:complete len:106 (-) Transcript_144621:1198-1515(-)